MAPEKRRTESNRRPGRQAHWQAMQARQGRSGDAARQTSSPAGLARQGRDAGRQCNDSSRMVPPDEGAPRLSDEHHV